MGAGRIVDERTDSGLGRAAGARYLVIGSCDKASGSQVTLSGAPSPSATQMGSVTFTVIFSEALSTFRASDVVLEKTGRPTQLLP